MPPSFDPCMRAVLALALLDFAAGQVARGAAFDGISDVLRGHLLALEGGARATPSPRAAVHFAARASSPRVGTMPTPQVAARAPPAAAETAAAASPHADCARRPVCHYGEREQSARRARCVRVTSGARRAVPGRAHV